MSEWDLGQLRALAAAADLGTLDAAARVLHLTPSAVSQRIKALEQSAGAVLLRRERPVRPTAAGEPLVRLARQIAALTSQADAERGQAPVPRVPLAVNGDSLHTWVLPALAPVAADVVLHFVREDQDRSADLLRDGSVMAAVTAQQAAVQGCTVEPLGVMRYHAVAAPAFRDRWFPRGPDAAALAVAPVVVFDASDRLQDRHLAAAGVDPAAPPRHTVPATADFGAAVTLGYGWGMLPEQQSAPGEAAGSLVRLAGPPVDVALHWQQWSLHLPSLDAVATLVRAAAREALRPGPPRPRTPAQPGRGGASA